MKLRWTVAASVMASAAIVLIAVSPASAALSASVDGVVLPEVVTSHEVQVTSGRIVLTATDDTATCVPPDPELGTEASGDGWHVSVHASPLVYSGIHAGIELPASALAVESVDPVPMHIDGPSMIDPTHGPKVPATSPVGSLDSPRIILTANPGYGCGTYTEGINLSLTIPADTIAGAYTSTISTTITTGP